MAMNTKSLLVLGLAVAVVTMALFRSYEAAQFAFHMHADRPARMLFLVSAVLGDARAQNNLAGMYAEGRGGVRSDSSAVYWYERAAAAGVLPAIFNLANFYEDGRGVPRSTPKAIALFQHAAEQGYIEASFNLGVLYSSHRDDFAPDYAIATQWYLKAANAGYASAQYNLGSLYATGLNGPKDIDQAQAWYEKAALQNHPKALLDLGTIHAFRLSGSSDPAVGLKLLSRAAAIPQTSAQARERLAQACGEATGNDARSPLCSTL